MNAFTDVFKSLNLWQYYVLNVENERRAVRQALESDVPVWVGPDVAGKDVVSIAQILKGGEFIEGLGSFAKRYGAHVNPKTAASVIEAAYRRCAIACRASPTSQSASRAIRATWFIPSMNSHIYSAISPCAEKMNVPIVP